MEQGPCGPWRYDAHWMLAQKLENRVEKQGWREGGSEGRVEWCCMKEGGKRLG